MTSLIRGATGHLCRQPLFSRRAWRKDAPGAPLAKAGIAQGQPHAGMEAV